VRRLMSSARQDGSGTSYTGAMPENYALARLSAIASGCQVLQLVAWARKSTSDATFGLFRDWQKTQT
jgi:hypothetical protein